MKKSINSILILCTIITLSFGCKSSNKPSFDPKLASDFFNAVENDNVEELKKLLVKESGLVYARDDIGFTALMKASRYGEVKTVELLLKSGAEINAQADMGETALFRTIDVNNYKAAELLLKHGANPNIKETSQDWSALQCAAYYGNLSMVKLLLDNGADVNAVGKYDQTPLHWSMRAITWNNQKEIVELLIKRGVNINHVDTDGRTALQMADKRSAEGVPELLRSHGAM
jgi:ankyrin repeat protein